MQDLDAANTEIEHLLRCILTATQLQVDFTIQHHPGDVPNLTVEFSGPDTPMLTACDAELLKAIEHLAAKVRGLNSDQHDLLSFDAGHYKVNRDRGLRDAAHRAATHVRQSRLPFAFPPMSSHERRQLHLILNAMGLSTASTGEGPERRLVLFPLPSAALGEMVESNLEQIG